MSKAWFQLVTKAGALHIAMNGPVLYLTIGEGKKDSVLLLIDDRVTWSCARIPPSKLPRITFAPLADDIAGPFDIAGPLLRWGLAESTHLTGDKPRKKRVPVTARVVTKPFTGLAAEAVACAYIGIPESSHGAAGIHRAVQDAVVLALKVWKWKATGLQVHFYSAEQPAACAYVCLPWAGVRMIALSHKLVKSYSLKSITRAVIHELCHHYREESFERSKDPHDEVFCRELAKADVDLVGKRCPGFYDMVDYALVKPEFAMGVVDPKEVILRIEVTGQSTKIRSVRGTEEGPAHYLTGKILVEILRQVAPTQWSEMQVEVKQTSSVGTLSQLIRYAAAQEHDKDKYIEIAVEMLLGKAKAAKFFKEKT